MTAPQVKKLSPLSLPDGWERDYRRNSLAYTPLGLSVSKRWLKATSVDLKDEIEKTAATRELFVYLGLENQDAELPKGWVRKLPSWYSYRGERVTTSAGVSEQDPEARKKAIALKISWLGAQLELFKHLLLILGQYEFEPHDGGECPACGGRGRLPDDCDGFYHEKYETRDETCDDCPKCKECDGTGEIHWNWDPDPFNPGTCSTCKKPDQVVMACSEFNDSKICLPCQIERHASECGCELWNKSEVNDEVRDD